MAGYKIFTRRSTALVLLVSLIMTLLTGCSDKEVPGQHLSNPNPFQVTELDDLPKPVTYPAKGYLGVKVPQSKTMSRDGVTTISYRENYLPVLVSEEKQVYAKLTALADLMGFDVFEAENSVKLVSGQTSIYLTQRQHIASYENALFSLNLSIPTAPLRFQREWYVPLDTTIRLLGSDAAYLGEEKTSADTTPLLLYPCEPTVQDRIAQFYSKMYSSYAFDYQKDLGYDVKNQKLLTLGSSLADFGAGLFTMDSYTWRYMLNSYKEGSIDIFYEKYIDQFADAMLQMDEAQALALLENTQNTLDRANAFWDTAAAGNTVLMEQHLEEVKDLLLYQNPNTRLVELGYLEEGFSRLQDIEKIGNAQMVLGYALSYLTLGSRFDSGDVWSREACLQFLEQKDALSKRELSDSLYQSLKRRIDSYNPNKGSHFIPRNIEWWKENIATVAVEGLAALESSYFGFLTWSTELWDTTLDFFLGEQLDTSACFQAGLLGVYYETDAMAVFERLLEESFQKGKSNWSAEDERNMRYACFNVAKACYISRELGCASVQDKKELKENPKVLERQTAINRELVQFLNDFSNPYLPFGLMPADLCNLKIDENRHYPQVVFAICELTGQVLDWKDESPAQKVNLEVRDEDEQLLAECATDEEGRFDLSFELGDIDTLKNDHAAKRTLNLYLRYKRYPVVMQPLEAECGKKYQLDGIHVGERSIDLLVYLNGARTSPQGETLLLVQQIDLGEESVAMDMPGTPYTAYLSVYGDITVSPADCYRLKDGVTIGSIYASVMGEDSLAGALVSWAEQETNDEFVVSKALRNDHMHRADEINQFVQDYRNINQVDPVLVISVVNGEIKSAEASIVNTKN